MKNFCRVFGEVVGGKMVLNEFGRIAETCWLEIPEHYENVLIEEFVVMPNHVHGIVVIDNGFCSGSPNVGDADLRPLQDRKQMLLSKAIHGYKSSVSRQIRKIGYPNFQWQRSFHDHVIRNEKGLNKIREYIMENPATWKNDDYYS